MNCTTCGHQLSASDRICPMCGAQVYAASQPAGAVPAGADGMRFCASCGSPIAPSQEACPVCGVWVGRAQSAAPVRAAGSSTAFCQGCGSPLAADAYVCPTCGQYVPGRVPPAQPAAEPVSAAAASGPDRGGAYVPRKEPPHYFLRGLLALIVLLLSYLIRPDGMLTIGLVALGVIVILIRKLLKKNT